jgi:hypothetical protein
MAYICSLDIGKRVCQHVGAPLILDVDEDSRANTEISLAYDTTRRAELRRNSWRFAIRTTMLRAIDTDTKLLAPKEWETDINYPRHSVVTDENGYAWISKLADNLGNEPGQTAVWDQYFGPMTVHLWDEDTSYYSGELVYKAYGSGGAYIVYMSLENGNEDTPSTAEAYAATTTYKLGDVVSYSGSQWRSLIEINIAHTPAEGPLDWDATAIYAASDTVTGSNGFIYSSVAGSNTGNDPVTTSGAWTNTGNPKAWSAVPEIPASANSWLPIYAAAETMTFAYPLGTGPSAQDGTRNVFRLPSGYLRKAAQDPKAGSHSLLGAPSGRDYEDWDLEGDFLISRTTGALPFRFVCDHVDVRTMDDMFCEGLAARVALAVCEPITQSSAKLGAIASVYKEFMSDARTMNAIEIGAEEPPEDDYITARR